VPVVEAYVLIHIGKAGLESAESLRAIVTDTSTNNYCAPLALVAVDPDSPKTRAALLQALKHPDPIERSNAAYALAKLPADNTTISALIAAVSADKSNALDPLGMHRPAAIAMLALARIAPEHPDVLKVFVGCLRPRLNDNDSIGSEYIRSAAISSLGEMEIYARPAVPEMLKVLNENPTSSEVYRLLNALEQIGADPALTRPALMSYHSSDSMAQQAIESFITRSSR
jgi:HEAT repeat protein